MLTLKLFVSLLRNKQMPCVKEKYLLLLQRYPIPGHNSKREPALKVSMKRIFFFHNFVAYHVWKRDSREKQYKKNSKREFLPAKKSQVCIKSGPDRLRRLGTSFGPWWRSKLCKTVNSPFSRRAAMDLCSKQLSSKWTEQRTEKFEGLKSLRCLWTNVIHLWRTASFFGK